MRIHKSYEDSEALKAMKFGLACFSREGVTAESIIDQFPAQIRRIAIEMDMGVIVSEHIRGENDHSLMMAAEYFLEEALSYPLMPEKYGIPITLPREYVAYLANKEENPEDEYPVIKEYTALSLLRDSDEYMMSALLSGFMGHVRKVVRASSEDIDALITKRARSLVHIDPSLLTDQMWQRAVIADPAVITFLPQHCDTIKYLKMACANNIYAFDKIRSENERYLADLMECSDALRAFIVDMAKTQAYGVGEILRSCTDDEFLEIAMFNEKALFDKDLVKTKPKEIILKVLSAYSGDECQLSILSEYLTEDMIEMALDAGIMDCTMIVNSRATEFSNKYSSKVASMGRVYYPDEIPW